MNCNQVEPLMAAFALGALEAPERQAVQEHVQGCPTCFPLAQEHLGATAMLARAVPVREPPAHLRARVLDRVAQAAAVRRPAPFAVPRPYPSERPLRIRWPAVAFGLAASFGILLLGALLGTLVAVRGDVAALRQQNEYLASVVNDQRTLSYALALPGMTTLVLRNTEAAPKARGMLMSSQDQTWGILVSINLEPLKEGMGYQLWLVRDQERTSGGVFAVDHTGYGQVYLKFPQPLGQFTNIGITQEPLSGSPGPTGKRVLEASLH